MRIKSRFFTFVLLIFVALQLLKNTPPSKNKLERIYYRNESELISVCSFIQENKFEEIRIDLFDYTNKIECYYSNNDGSYEKIIFEITDKKILNDLETLKDNGIERILKEYNYICFQVWSCFDESVCLVYSPYNEPNISEVNAKEKFVEKIVPQEWYRYYEKSS